MKPLKISYTYYAKYKDHLYCRVRQAGVRTMDVNLHTTDKVVAENFVKLRRSELELYNRYVLAGEAVPEEVERKLLRRGSPVEGQKGASGPVSLLTTAMDAWEQELRRRGKREATVASYTKQVRLTVPTGSTTADINRKSVRTWLAKHDSMKTATRKSYSVALREFVKFLVSEYGVDPNIVTDWPMTKVLQEERGYWTMQQMYHLIEAIKCQDPEQEEAMKAYCWVMATTGARQGEAGLLRWADYKDGSLTFRAENTKSNKTRRVPLDMRICQMIDKLPRKNQYIFASIPKGQPGRYALVAKAVRRSGVPAGGLHTFRHSACMYLYSRCSDIKAIAQMVGHSPAVSLQYYVKSRQVDELRSIVKDAYESEQMIPNAMDDLIKAGLV